MELAASTWIWVIKVTSHIQGRYRLAESFLKIRPVCVSFIRKEALPTTPHASDSSVEGGPIVTEVHNRHHTAHMVFNDLAFPLAIYHANTDLELTLTSGDKHIFPFGRHRSAEKSSDTYTNVVLHLLPV